MNDTTPHVIDLSDAIALIERAKQLLIDVDGRQYADVDVKNSSAIAAELSRPLLAATHVLRRAAGEVEAQYWAGRGYPDLLAVP